MNKENDTEFITYESVKDISTEEYFEGNIFSIDAFNRKYLLHPSETYIQAIKRVCDAVAGMEQTKEDQKYWSERWFDEIYNDWWHPAGSIMQGAGANKNISLANCFSRDTKFITEFGVKSFEDFNDGDTVSVLTKAESFKKATVKRFGKQSLLKLTVKNKSITKEIYCTPNHLWNIKTNTVKITKETQDLVSGDKIPFKHKRWNISSSNNSRYWCPIGFIHGLVFGDGTLYTHDNYCNLDLCGDSMEYVEFFNKGFNWKIKYDSDQKIRICYLPSWFKKLPDVSAVNSEYLLGFIVGWIAADGSIDPHGRTSVSSSKIEHLEWLYNAGQIVGIYGSNIRMNREISPFSGEYSPNYDLYIRKNSLFKSMFVKSKHKANYEHYISNKQVHETLDWHVVSVEETDRAEEVWCVQEPVTESFVLEGGVETHNCSTTSLGAREELTQWDNLESIIRNCAYTVAKSAAFRQGQGIDFSALRPRGMSVQNSASEGTGAVHWMKFIDSIGYYVGQFGRIPALLISLRVDHPDVIEFIKSKSDYTTIQNANISVQCTDAFYEAVKKRGIWKMEYIIPGIKKGDKVYIDVHSALKDALKDDKGFYTLAKRDRKEEVFYVEAPASEILELIAKGMCEYAEPGIQNIDTAVRESNSDYVYDPGAEYNSRIISTNACCVDINTKILTNNGYITIDKIKNLIDNNEPIMAMSYNIETRKFELKPIINFWQQRNDTTITLEIEYMDVPMTIECSEDHPVYTLNRGYVEAGKINHEDKVLLIHKNKKGINYGTLKSSTVNSETKPLYDIEVQDNHNFIANGVLVKNSEQYLSRDSLCILGSINIGKFSIDPKQYKSQLKTIGHSINRFLDNVNEYELVNHTYATPHQKLAIEHLRRTGAGFTNMEAWLFKQKLPYGSDEGNKAIEEFQKWYNYYLYESSIAIGTAKGNFKLFNKEKLEKSPFIQRMIGMGLKFNTLRNITCSSIAPTGSLSLMFRGLVMSYGIEKGFGPYYWKRTRISGKYEYYFNVPRVVRDAFEEAGLKIPMESDTIKDTWDGKYGMPIVSFINENMDKLGIEFKDSSTINIFNKLDLMCKVQKWVDSSLSTTYMLPEDSNWKDVYDFILLGWERGLKSIAAFPDRKMYGIVSFIPFKELAVKLMEEKKEIHAQNFTPEELKQLSIPVYAPSPKRRPKEIDGDICTATAKGKKFLFFVGIVGGKPFEMFGGELPDNMQIKDGKATMVKVLQDDESKLYSLRVGDISFDNFGANFAPHEEAMFRAVSYMLQNGDSIDRIAKYLKGCSHREGISSLYSATRRVLLKYSTDEKDNVITKVGKNCPACNSSSVFNEAGCIKCLDCGWSKCE